MNLKPEKTKSYIKKALSDDKMRSAVSRAAAKAVEKRNRTAGEYPYWQTMREHAHAVKRHVMENLDDFLLQFEENCRNKIGRASCRERVCHRV